MILLRKSIPILVGKFSNILSRSAPFIAKNNHKLAPILDESFLAETRAKEGEIYDLFESKNYSKAIKLIMEIADNTNKYISSKATSSKNPDHWKSSWLRISEIASARQFRAEG